MPKLLNFSAKTADHFVCFLFILWVSAAWISCKNPGDQHADNNADSVHTNDTPMHVKPDTADIRNKIYQNTRFRNVVVRKIAEHRYEISGEGQIFEAAFSWVVEDGHDELQKGFEMTDAGAPEWGKFRFEIEVEKRRPNSTLILILFESSPEDGSRQYELPIFLE